MKSLFKDIKKYLTYYDNPVKVKEVKDRYIINLERKECYIMKTDLIKKERIGNMMQRAIQRLRIGQTKRGKNETINK